MIWNLFLAWLAFLVSLFFLIRLPSSVLMKLKKNHQKLLDILLTITAFLIWLFLFPNTFYMITDFVHLRTTNEIGVWFDLILISSFAVNGLILGLFSLKILHNFFITHFNRVFSNLLLCVVIFFTSFGIYLGRFLRWNSWDILLNPGDMVSDVYERVVNPLAHPTTYGVTLFLGVFILLVYLVFNAPFQGVALDQPTKEKNR